jgi:16S rRNA (adenine1518-N6/adenine1519-N6)-dimethyltransferase
VKLLSPADVAALLARHGGRPSKALGQNFLADPNTARRIVRLAGVEVGDRVVEIGPGIGSLTLALADAGADVTAIELDRHLLPVLDEVLSTAGVADRVRVVQADALKVDWDGLLGGGAPSGVHDAPPGHDARPERPWALVANLPYNVATPLVVTVLEAAPTVTSMLVMVQREVAERWCARPGPGAYGAVTVKIAYFARAEIAGLVPATVFVPRPNVESALVRLVRHPRPPVDVADAGRLFALIRTGFAQRRKTLRRALAPMLGDGAGPVLEAAGIDPSARAETLDLEAWAALARAVPALSPGATR